MSIQNMSDEEKSIDRGDEAIDYSAWLQRRRLTRGHRQAAIDAAQRWVDPPRIGVILVNSHADPLALPTTLASLEKQLYRACAIDVVDRDDLAAVGAACTRSSADWVYFFDAGDQIDELALYLVAESIRANDELQAIYADEDTAGAEGYLAPVFRPDINLDLLRGYPYTGNSVAFARSACAQLGGFDAAAGALFVHDMLLKIVERDGLPAVGHIDEVLRHTAVPFAQWLAQGALDEPLDVVLGGHLDRIDVAHTLAPGPFSGSRQVHYQHDAKPRVSIVVPVHDDLPRLRVLLDSLLTTTGYPNYDVVLVDNASGDPAVRNFLDGLAQLEGVRFHVVRHASPVPMATLWNSAITSATGDYLVFLQEGSAILQRQWLDTMLRHALRAEVGVVGATVLDATGAITGAGTVLGLDGFAGPAFQGELLEAPGYLQRLKLDQNYSAVDDGCLMVRRSLFVDVDGFDDALFPARYHAADLCLKIRSSGHLTVWTPHARVLGPVATALPAPAPIEPHALFGRWESWLVRDPAYNRNMSLAGGSYRLNEERAIAWQPFAEPLVPRALGLVADTTGCGHYRMIQPFQAMQRDGLIEGMLAQRYLGPVELSRLQVDTIILQRQLTEPQLARIAELDFYSRAFRVYENDDYGAVSTGAFRKQVRQALAMVDRAVVSTPRLADQISSMHHDIRIVPNRLPMPWWDAMPMRSVPRTGKPRVGWAGGATHGGDLKLIADVVRDLANDVDFVFFGMCPEALRPYVREYHEGVPIEAYPARLASLDLDLAMAPLEDTVFNECRSHLRLLENGACGYPVVCSDVPAYRGSLPVTRVKNRYRDWVAAIWMHVGDRQASLQAGAALQAEVRANWMLTGQHLLDWRAAWLPG
jgi:hypothetical protein